MKSVIFAISLLPCQSEILAEPLDNVTVAFSCPKTAIVHWWEEPEGPTDIAKMKHYYSLPRDDRPPLPVAKKKAEATTAQATKKKRKKKRRRG